MKTTIAGLIPIAPFAAYIGHLFLAGVCFLSSGVHAAVDDWPATAYYSPYDPLSEITAEEEYLVASALACRPSVQISLDQAGQALVTPAMLVIAPQYPLGMYVVDIMGPLTNQVTCANIGQELMAMVEELPTGNFCMSTLIIEDKLKPFLSCVDDTIPCNVDILGLDFLSFLDVVDDNCDVNPTVYFDYTITELNCDPDGIAGYIDIIYYASDDYGNTNSCDQRIYLEKFDLVDVDFPADTMINCDGANSDPSVTGEPTIEGEPIHHFCELIAWKTDNVIPMCSGQTKILRLWRVMDWCTGVTITDLQEILIIDTVPPNLICPVNLTLGTFMLQCSASYTLPTPVVTDVCSDDALIDISFNISDVPGIFLPGQQELFDLGLHVITVSATDDCGNTATCHYTVTVIDDDNPVVVCNNLTITLDNNGMAFLNANSSAFNATDNCGIASKAVRRMDDNCDTPGNLVFGPSVKFCCEDIGEVVMVIFQVIDLSGNVSTCMIQVTVKDGTPPTALCKNACIFLGPNGTVTLPVDSIDNGSFDNCEIVNRQLSKTLYNCSNVGDQVVILTVSDASGNTASCTAIVEVKDTVPPVARCRDITVELNEMGMIVITVGMVNNGSTDNCLIDTLYLTQDEFDCSDVGANEVELVVVDVSGLADTCSATVTIEDMPPMVMCMDVTVYLDEMGDVSITPDDVDGVSDDCSMPTRVVTPDSFDCTDIGDNIVVMTATDGSGNTASCSATVTVFDTLPPVCNAMDLTIQLDADGSVTLAGNALNDGSTDNCAILSITINPNTFTCAHTDADVLVVQTVTDVNGNTSTCTAFVTVEDNLDPICLTKNIIVQLNAAGMATITNTAVNDGSTDNCGIESILLNDTQFNCADVGVVVIVIQTVTDVNGNTSTCTASVTVQDNIDPICTTQDITVQLNASGMVTIGNSAVNNGSTDACGIFSITVTPTTFDCDDVGVVIVTQTVTDVNGNSSTCTADVTVQDNIDPICLTEDITVTLGPDGTVTIPGNAVDDGSSDNCDILTITVNPNQFDCNSPAVIVVVQTVTDENGNTSTCTANVTVVGGDEPIAECIDITVFLDESGTVTITGADVNGGSSSLCGDIILTVDPDEFDCEDIGPNTVTLTVTDAAGGTATCTATVTVLDTLAPICNTDDITVILDANGNATITIGDINDGISDNCAIETLVLDQTSFDCDDTGVVTVTITATDASGNVALCDAEVTVIDNMDPICMAQDITITLDGAGNATITPGQINNGSSDNCGPVTLSVNPSTFDCDDVMQVNIVVLTVTDESGNTSTCTAIVTVEDPGGLVASCQNLTVFLNAMGMVVVTPNQVNNGSGGGCFAGNLTFALSEMNFDCSETGANIVTLTVTDMMGNTATCTSIITVIDNTPPVILCPPNMNADCADPINLNNLTPFGTPTTSDNCPPVTVVESVVDNRNDCGQGTIVRTFVATDPSGNTSQCSQTITVGDPDPFDVTDIIWPPALVNLGPCSSTNPGPGNQPVINAGSCTNISVAFSDVVIMTMDNNPATPCKQITRTWTVIDSCQLQQGTQNGIFTFVQMIIMNDNVGPVFNNINDITVNANSVTCVGAATLIATATDCGMATPITNNFNAGGANASGNFPVGTTTVIFTSTDGCGNISTMEVNVTVIDPNPAIITCIKLITFLPEELEIDVMPEQFIQFIAGSCTTLDDFLVSFSPTDPFDTINTYNCQHAGSVEPVTIYFFDLNGNPLDTCRGDLDLRDPTDFCGNGLTVTGEIFGENRAMIQNVPVLISEPTMQTVTTSSSGRYVYRDLEMGSSYEITPFWNVNHKYGVSTLDLAAIQKHLLGIREIDTPYKLIAADANNSGSVTISDLLELRRLLLDQIPAFTQNTSWRFVDAHYEFPDSQNPWAHAFPERMSFAPIMEHMVHMDFVGVKVGDVNNTVFLLQPEDEEVEVRSSNAMILAIEDRFMKAGETLEIPVTVNNYHDLVGYQFALQFDINKAVFEGISVSSDGFLDIEWFGLNQVELGLISTLWHEPSARAIAPGEVLFYISLRAIENVQLSDLLGMAENTLAPEAYGVGAEQVLPVRLAIDGKIRDLDFVVFQNVPNPFTEGTLIPVQVPERSGVVLEVYSYDGRLVHKQSKEVDAGYYEFVLSSEDLERGGMYYYTISTNHFRGTRKMILLD